MNYETYLYLDQLQFEPLDTDWLYLQTYNYKLYERLLSLAAPYPMRNLSSWWTS